MKGKIQKIIDYLFEDEKRHFEESDKPKNHIFINIKEVDDWLNSSYCPLVEKEEIGDCDDVETPKE